MEENAEQVIGRMLGEEDLDAEAVLAKLVELLVRDHLADRAKANGGAGTTAINHPTTLWHVEKVLAEELRDQGGMSGGPIDPRVGTLAVLLVTIREKAEDEAKATEDARPRMRIVRD